MLSKFCLCRLSVIFFHVHYLQVITRFLLQFGVISIGNHMRPSTIMD